MAGMLAFILVLLIVGDSSRGALARLLVPGRDPIGLWDHRPRRAGSFLGGFILEPGATYHTLAVHHRAPPGSSAPSSAP